MAYSIDSRVSYSKVGIDKSLKLGAVIDYFQDCSTFQSEDIGKGIDQLLEENMAWMLTSWQIVIKRKPVHGERIKITTLPYGFRNCYGDRNFTIHTEDGELLVYANSIWVLVNIVNGHPVRRIPEHIAGAYTLDTKIDMEYAPRKIKVKGDYEALPAIRIQRSQIDSNNHVNNSQYVYMAEGCIPSNLKYNEVRVEYKNPAVLGDEIIPKLFREDERIVVRLDGVEDQTFATVEFIFSP